MAAGSTYTPITTQTVSAQSTVSFTSIPSTYTDLVLITCAKSSNTGSSNNDFRVQLNSDTGSNYSETKLYGQNNGGYGSVRDSNQTVMYIGNLAQASLSPQISIINFFNYSNTTTYKTVMSRGSVTEAEVATAVGLWRSTSAINRIDLFLSGQTITGTFTLYGISAA